MSGSTGGQIAGLVVGATIGFMTGGVGLALVGSTLSGAAIGYSIGGIIDPPSGPKIPDTTGPRIDGARVNMPSEGAPVHFLIGPQVRVAGNLIWAGELIESREEVV